jgi:hypothetical protein
MEANTTTKYGERELGSRTAVGRTVNWLQSYLDGDSYSDAPNEAQSIINGLKTVRQRSGLDELLAFIGQIAKKRSGFAGNKQGENPAAPTREKTGKET